MLVGLPTVAVMAMIAELAGNSATRPATRMVFATMVLIELQVAATVGGAATWLFHGVLSLL